MAVCTGGLEQFRARLAFVETLRLLRISAPGCQRQQNDERKQSPADQRHALLDTRNVTASRLNIETNLSPGSGLVTLGRTLR